MKNPMNRRFLRELKSDFGKYLVIFLFIVMVVSVVSSFLVANAGVARSYHDGLKENRVEDGHMSFNIDVDESFLSAMEASADITLYPAYFFEETNNGSTLRIYQLGSDINLPAVLEGRLPEKDDEIAIDNVHITKTGFKVGDRIPVDGKELTITGLVSLPSYSALFMDNADLMFDIENFGIGVMSKDGFTAFSSDHTTISYAWLYKDTPKTDKEKQERSEKVLEALRNELIVTNTKLTLKALTQFKQPVLLEIKDYLPAFENKAINFAGEDMNGDGAAMEIFLYIVVAVLAFIVSVTTINTLQKEAAVIGTLRASGYSRSEMVFHYLALPFIVFVIGMIVGNVLGYTLMKDFFLQIYRSMYSLGNIKTEFHQAAFIKTTLIPGVIMIVINFLILSLKMRVSPLSYLRREISGKKKKRALRLSTKIPFTWRFRIRIILQNMSNYITMAVGVVLAGSIIIFGLMFEPLLNEVAERIDNTTISKYQYILKTPEKATEETAERFALSSLETTKKSFKTDEVSVYGIEKESRYIKTAIPEGQVLLSNGYMDKYGVKSGDTVSLYDKYANATYSFTVAGEYPYEASLAIFMNRDDFCEVFKKDADYYSGYFADSELNSLTKSNVYMILDSKTFSSFADQLWRSFADMMEPVKWFGVIMFVLMVYLLAKQIIEKNATSISMTKILGFSGGEIGGLYIVSTSIIVILSLIFSVPLVDWLLRLIWKGYLYQRMSGYLPYCVGADCYGKMVIIGIISYIAVVMLQLLKIQRIKKSEALKTLE